MNRHIESGKGSLWDGDRGQQQVPQGYKRNWANLEKHQMCFWTPV